jgi:hypothetical protein
VTIASAVGHAVFSNFGMKMVEIQAGLAVELTAKGTRYYKDDDLN